MSVFFIASVILLVKGIYTCRFNQRDDFYFFPFKCLLTTFVLEVPLVKGRNEVAMLLMTFLFMFKIELCTAFCFISGL